jgi:cytoskeletal protein RodZ
MRFGHELKEQREKRGIALDDVAVATRISLRHLHALEAERFQDLPGGVFNRGIVRSYSAHCGLDPEATLQNFNQALRSAGIEPEPKEDDWVEFAEAVRRSRKTEENAARWRWVGVVGILTAVLALAVCVLWVLVHRGVFHVPERTRTLAIRQIR